MLRYSDHCTVLSILLLSLIVASLQHVSGAAVKFKPVKNDDTVVNLNLRHNPSPKEEREEVVDNNVIKPPAAVDKEKIEDVLHDKKLAMDSHLQMPAVSKNVEEKMNDAGRKDDLRTTPKPDKALRFHNSTLLVGARLRFPTDLVPLALDDVRPPDHIDGVRMEQDGHLNRDYQKEVMVGNHHEFETESDSKLLSRLKIIFNKADTNHDGFLVKTELQNWILFKVKEHLNEATKENARIFSHLDVDHDGYVTWKEFHVHYLLAKGYSQQKAEKHSEDYDTVSLESSEREQLIRYKFRWAEADETPEDNRLSVDEMKNFRHPEQSPPMLDRMVKDILENLDQDGDNILTEDEFAALPRGQVDVGAEEQDKLWQDERRKEFKNVIDVDHNGLVDESELKMYVDPYNSNHAHLEAGNLIQLADDDHDGRLSITEVLDNSELFFGSKVVNAGGNFHDEF